MDDENKVQFSQLTDALGFQREEIGFEIDRTGEESTEAES